MAIDQDLKQQLDQITTENQVLLFMKGNKNFPMCGFSANTVECLKLAGFENFATVNVLENEDVRAALKEYSDWPTFPQLYIKGEFIGGADIVKDMFDDGELQKLAAEINSK
jgi:monothiol glutaredoxin